MKISEIKRSAAMPGVVEKYQEPLSELTPVPRNPDYYYDLANFSGLDRLNFTNSDGQFTLYHKINDTTAEMIGYIKFRIHTLSGLPNAIQISNTGLHTEYRGRGFGLMMYNVMMGLGYTIIADESQTPQARKLWVKLANAPGVKVRGIVWVPKEYIDPELSKRYTPASISEINTLLKKINAHPMSQGTHRRGYIAFEFPLQSNGEELGADGARLYTNSSSEDYFFWGMYAQGSSFSSR